MHSQGVEREQSVKCATHVAASAPNGDCYATSLARRVCIHLDTYVVVSRKLQPLFRNAIRNRFKLASKQDIDTMQ